MPDCGCNMDILNEDCLFKVFNYLDLSDLFNLSKAIPALCDAVHSQWRYNTSHCISPSTFEYFDSNNNDLVTFLDCISPTLRKLSIYRVKFNQLKSWEDYCFVKLQTLDIKIDEEESASDGILTLVKLFPNLTSLKIECDLDGEHIWLWTQLRTLELESFSNLSEEHFCKIIATLPLQKLALYTWPLISQSIFSSKTLEEFFADERMLTKQFVTQLMEMPRLRKINSTTRNGSYSIISMMSEICPSRVKKITFKDSFWICELQQIKGTLPNLTHISLTEEYTNDEVLKSLIQVSPSLNEIHISYSTSCYFPLSTWNTISASPSLQLFRIDGRYLDESFFNYDKESLTRVLDRRSSPLHFHILNAERHTKTIKENFIHRNLELRLYNLHDSLHSDGDDGFIEVEFSPLESIKL